MTKITIHHDIIMPLAVFNHFFNSHPNPFLLPMRRFLNIMEQNLVAVCRLFRTFALAIKKY